MPTPFISDVELVNSGFSHPAFRATQLKATTTNQTDAMRIAVAKAQKKVVISPALHVHLGAFAKQSTPQFAASMIAAKYKMLDGSKSWLKKATTTVKICPDKEGYFRLSQGKCSLHL